MFVLHLLDLAIRPEISESLVTLNIANHNALQLPLDFVTERISFLARTGAGKSVGMRVMAEEMVRAGQFIGTADLGTREPAGVIIAAKRSKSGGFFSWAKVAKTSCGNRYWPPSVWDYCGHTWKTRGPRGFL